MSDGFRDYLRRQSESKLWESEGDDQHDGMYYWRGAASCFFPVDAHELVKDGLDSQDIARFCIEAAMESLLSGGASLEETEQKIFEIALSLRVTGEFDPKKAA